MTEHRLKSNIILLLAAAIWGFAFVAQRVGAEYLGAFSYNWIKFALGGISLIPLLFLEKRFSGNTEEINHKLSNHLIPGIIAGIILFIAASLQQIGMTYTSAGKGAFITGLYIILVPIFAIFLKHIINLNIWIGALIAITGLYLLSVSQSFSIEKGDLFVLIGSIFWAIHILTIDHFIKKTNAIKLSFIQFLTCSIISFIGALLFEKNNIYCYYQALIPILYGGICSVGIAYTLQVVGQKYAKPSHAAIILSMETVFGAIGGFFILNENLGIRGYIGCILMLSGMLLSQVKFKKTAK